MELLEGLLGGNKRAAARVISLLEDREPGYPEILAHLHPHTGRAHVVGISGPPGSGKSTLIYRMAREYRRRERRVGILAIDPTSPLTGGALLGDRIRMQDLTADEGVYIRSMGTRGGSGAISEAAAGAIKVMDAMGCDVVLVETAGAGQSEVAISGLVHTTVVVEMPGAGDDVQVMKAGILEVGDVLVVNKGDQQGADALAASLESMLDLGEGRPWRPPVMITAATEGKGLVELLDAVEAHRRYLAESGELRRRAEERTRRELLDLLQREVMQAFLAGGGDALLEESVRQIVDREIDLHTAAQRLLSRSRGSP
jgi:LAO/AO transport system kinase